MLLFWISKYKLIHIYILKWCFWQYVGLCLVRLVCVSVPFPYCYSVWKFLLISDAEVCSNDLKSRKELRLKNGFHPRNCRQSGWNEIPVVMKRKGFAKLVYSNSLATSSSVSNLKVRTLGLCSQFLFLVESFTWSLPFPNCLLASLSHWYM